MRQFVAIGVFAGCGLAGTLLDRPPATHPAAGVLVADLHVHPYPGDGSLPVWELQNEARRRGLDVVAVTAHNNRVALALGRLRALDPQGPIMIPGQEITAPRYHLVAVGIERMVDWRLPARDAIAAIHAQGGVAIAAHPVPASWRDADVDALRALDGTEVAHPSTLPFSNGRRYFQWFFERVQAVNADVAPIGSTDFHMTAPLGLCRTYVLTDDRSAAAVIDAIRRGRTVARDATGRLHGSDANVAVVEAYLADRGPIGAVPLLHKLVALCGLASLAVLVRATR